MGAGGWRGGGGGGGERIRKKKREAGEGGGNKTRRIWLKKLQALQLTTLPTTSAVVRIHKFSCCFLINHTPEGPVGNLLFVEREINTNIPMSLLKDESTHEGVNHENVLPVRCDDNTDAAVQLIQIHDPDLC